ncbi:uncharacterized protein TRAVEDRAFT_37330 [Trametes versicolor FP-101664 SS1]|uniref:uncharacterized protein n=1 Tax=Trametes versicolor (strain FP-101664) TaxID=717944 RepID=UPI0004621F65|nr:uncharacterized protein TRAVEDRAFT_37330 [Trametes versicolor FP-101664 SS1]EIW58389.1 hypothetical protein TRAVEDRAFT_37330 [Trametes versicolor FP-101664 SS1]
MAERSKIAASERPLPQTTPHLMPFHIAYSGPAPISTYFLVRDAPEPTFGRETKSTIPDRDLAQSQDISDSQTTLVASSSTFSGSLGPSSSSATITDVNMQELGSDKPRPRHFASAFRGRTMHGLEVALPEGYAGVVLRAPDDRKRKSTAPPSRVAEEQDSKARAKAKSKGAGRTTRQAKRAAEPVEDEAEEEGAAGGQDAGPARVLTPAAMFSSFVLWHPDIPVDESRDEYMRSLTEWTRLSAEIHRVDDC